MASDRVLIVGAGFGGLEVAIRLRRARPQTSVTLVNPAEHLTYRPWLIRLPVGQQKLEEMRVPLTGAARRFGFELVVDHVTALDPGGKAELASGEHIHFSHTVVATGARTDPGRFPGGPEHAFTPCDTDEAALFAEAFRKLESGCVTVIIAGERPGPGLEYAGWLVKAARRGPVDRGIRVVRVVDAGGALAAVLGPQALARVKDHFVSRGHEFITDGSVQAIGADHVLLGDEHRLASDLTAVIGPLVAGDLGLPPDAVDDRGFVQIGRTFNSPTYPELFAVGDAAGPPDGAALPKSMIMARRQARTVAGNVARALDGQPLVPFDVESARRMALVMPDFGGRTVVVRDQRLLASGRLPLLLRTFIDRSYFRTRNFGH